jgi:SulP family sulfate permease
MRRRAAVPAGLLFKLGMLVRYVPVSIVIGFTNGIAVLIALSQVKDWLGLSIDKMPGDFFSQVGVLGQHLGTLNPYALGLGLPAWAACSCGRACSCTARRCCALPRRPHRALFCTRARARGGPGHPDRAGLCCWLPVETIGSRFGGIPQLAASVCAARFFSWDTVRQLVTPTVTIALLGAIESLLCARVADKLATTRGHRSTTPTRS